MNSILSRQRQIQLFTPLLCAILGSAFGCSPGDISLTAGDGGGETSGGLGGSTSVSECVDVDLFIDDLGKVWGKCEGWNAWAEVLDTEAVVDAIESGDWISIDPMAGAPCFLFSPDAIACIPEVAGMMLFARPLEQLQPIHEESDAACGSAIGPWAWTWWSGFRCSAVLDGDLVVEIRVAP